MRNFWRHLKAAWRYGRQFPYVPEADGSWTDADAKAAKGFFESGTGRKLAVLLKNFAVQSAMSAVQKPSGDHAAGIAAGIAMSVAMLDSHTVYQEEEETDLKVVNYNE